MFQNLKNWTGDLAVFPSDSNHSGFDNLKLLNKIGVEVHS
jgi:hypothetical protein